MNPGRNKVLTLGACSLLLVIGAWIWSREKEPVYKGKTLTLWLKTYCWPENPTVNDLFSRLSEPIEIQTDPLFSLSRSERDRREAAVLEKRREEAADAVRHIGTKAIPELLHGIDGDFPLWRARLADLCRKLPPSFPGRRFMDWWLVARYEFRVQRSIYGFVVLQTNAAPAVPELTRRMNTRTSRSGFLAIVALTDIGSPGLKPLLQTLADTNALNRPSVARLMCQAIRNLGTNDVPAAVQAVAQCVSDPDSAVASWSAITLGSLRMEPDLVVPALSKGLSDPRPGVHFQCANALGNFGAAASSAVSNLTAIASDPEAYVKNEVTNALREIAKP